MTAIGFPSGSSQSPIFGFDQQLFHTTLTTAGFTLWVVKITDIRFRITAFSHQCDHTRIAPGSLKYSIFDFDSLPSHATVTTIGFTSGSLRSSIFDSDPLPSQGPVTRIGVVTSGSLNHRYLISVQIHLTPLCPQQGCTSGLLLTISQHLQHSSH